MTQIKDLKENPRTSASFHLRVNMDHRNIDLYPIPFLLLFFLFLSVFIANIMDGCVKPLPTLLTDNLEHFVN